MKGQDIESQDFKFRDGKNNSQDLSNLQILVIGDAQTGKTSLTKILTHKSYPDTITIPRNVEKTQGCEYRVSLRKNMHKKYHLKFMDLSGDKAQRSYLDIYLSRFKMDAIIYCFDVTNLKTLDNIRKWIQRMTQKGNIQEENSQQLDTDRSEYSRQSSVTVQEEQDCLISYQNFNGIPIDELLHKPFIFVGCKMDLIPMDKHELIRLQVQEKIQSIYKKSHNFILLSTTKPKIYSDQYEVLEKSMYRIHEKQNLEEFYVREKIQSKMIKLNESFWKKNLKSSWYQRFTLLTVYCQSFWSKLFCKKHKH